MKMASLKGQSLAMLEWLLSYPVCCWRTRCCHNTESGMPNTYLGTGRQASERMNKSKKEQEQRGHFQISVLQLMMGRINHSCTVAKRRGNRPAKEHHDLWPWQPLTAGTGQHCPPASNTDASWVSFQEVAVLKATKERPWGRTIWCCTYRGWAPAGCCSTAAVTAQIRVKEGNHSFPVTRLATSYRLGK